MRVNIWTFCIIKLIKKDLFQSKSFHWFYFPAQKTFLLYLDIIACDVNIDIILRDIEIHPSIVHYNNESLRERWEELLKSYEVKLMSFVLHALKSLKCTILLDLNLARYFSGKLIQTYLANEKRERERALYLILFYLLYSPPQLTGSSSLMYNKHFALIILENHINHNER